MKKYLTSFLVLTISFFLIWGFARPYHISGDCMEPAIKDGKLYFLDRITPFLRKYQINDIILFNHEGKTWISRVVALENNTIQIDEGRIVVNDNMLPNNKITRNWSKWKYGSYAINQPFQVPSHHLFVLSDNLSAQHDDSRVFGSVSQESVLGLVR
ncbi:MAG: signal peptidase I [Legionella sp.]|nr:MAG: signal peptidase I [Legionella sp.]